MSTYKLAAIIKNPANEDEFLVVKQARPREFGIEEYDSHVDPDLWDFPSVQLSILQSKSEIHVEGAELCSDKLDLSKFDWCLALNQELRNWLKGSGKFWKYVEEPEFGPGAPIHTIFITGYHALSESK
ncbi:hypothetical protein RDABS01_003522, partial [Bienertia sinuspersici]